MKINDLVLGTGILWTAVQKGHLFVPKYNQSVYMLYEIQYKPWNTSTK